MSKLFISCALPYANGPCHLGHLRSTYIPADIYARYNRMNGVDTVMVCSTDEHGTPIAVRAEQENKSPKDITDVYHELIGNDLKACNISLDSFRRTTDELHYEMAQDFFKDLYNKGYIYEKIIDQLYCDTCKRSLPDRYVEGICPHCESEARGDQCEVCGRHLNPTDLKEPHCLICDGTPHVQQSKQYYFKLHEFEEPLTQWINNNENLPKNVKNFAKEWLNDGLKDWIMTRDMNWGIPVPLEGVTDKVLYVWAEAFIGYQSSAATWAKKHGLNWKEYWDDKTVHFIGKDIIYHHTIFWPSMLLGHEWNLPYSVVGGGYLSLEGRKMSTSKGWVIWVKEFLDQFDSDLLRYYMVINAPLNRDTDFSWDDFQRRINNELTDNLGNFIHRTFTFTNKFFEGKLPEPGSYDEIDKEFENKIKELPDKVADCIENFKFRDGLVEIMALTKEANKYFNDKKPWKAMKEDSESAKTCIYLSNQLVYKLAILLTPYIPESAQKIRDILGMPVEDIEGFMKFENREPKVTWTESKEFLEAGHEIKKAKPLFNKIEDKIIEEQKNKLYSLENTENNNEDENMSDLISIDEFGKVQLVVGQIKEAERIDGSKNLLKLQVDLGDEIRQVVAGLAKRYNPEELIDRKVIVVANLEPAKLFGVESNGMLLATDSMELLTTEGNVGEHIK
ncbi:methionine--tRNA ligase [Methanosphaera sp. WGK6]|uniref:methionine--tRNA ligase n=1 Tax=Methanosphaera sp. WGK6 TaxID=1561964 RepID=UPI00084C6C97|nr:methionine--tRNA ligase [Methanosphaera sp. WGK6]OED30865.1 methionyl-tRNA synthetase [Methanosphaera sp. WGK6]